MSELPGGILAIDAHSGPATSEADVAELQNIVHSMVIEELPPTRIATGGPPIPLPTERAAGSGQLLDGQSVHRRRRTPSGTALAAVPTMARLFSICRAAGRRTTGLCHKHLGLPGEVGFSAWAIDRIYDDPCHWRDSAMYDLTTIHSQEDEEFHLAVGDKLPNQFGTTTGTQVLIDRTLSVKIEQSVPANLDMGSCDDGQYRTWSEWNMPGGANSHHAPGQVDTIYIVDVDRRPLVLDASRMSQASLGDVTELNELVDDAASSVVANSCSARLNI